MVSNFSSSKGKGMDSEQCTDGSLKIKVLAGGGVEEESKKSSPQVQPWLLISDREKFHIQTNMFNNNKHPLLYDIGGEFPQFLGRALGCSFGEWVLFTSNSVGNEILVNLLSKEMIELPLLDFNFDYCTLTSHPYDPTCHIVFFNEEDTTLMFFQPGDREYTVKKWDYELFPTQAVVVAGKLFVYLQGDTMEFLIVGIIEFKESTYQFEAVKMETESRNVFYGRQFCFEYSGELFAACRIFRTQSGGNFIGFEISKADFLNKKWVSVKNLGRVAIFIGYETAYVLQCASVKSGIEANSIYFLESHDVDNYYIYNLKEGTIRLKPVFSSVEMKTKVYKQLDWIMMPCDASFPKLVQESIFQDSEEENNASVAVEEVGVQNSWNTVPPELLNLIQLHLFGRDHAVFRVAWHQVSILDYSVPSMPALLSWTTLLEELCQSSSPLLMFQEDLTISDDSVPIFRFFDPVHRKWYRTGIPELRETEIHQSRDGWLLVSRFSDESIFFFNPLTREKIELPRIHSDFYAEYYSLSFSSLPTRSDCLVIVVHRTIPLMYTLKHGEETWREVELDGESIREYGNCPVVLNGLHHFMCENRDMVLFNFKDGFQYHLRQTWPSKYKRPDLADDFYLEIDGALAFVTVYADGSELSIFKWNDLKKDWELMEEGGGLDFGGKEMFLSKRGGSFMEKIDGGMGNTIFLPMIDEDAKEGVFYSLATHKYHTLYSGYSYELPYNADKFLNGVWVKPDREMVGDSNLKWCWAGNLPTLMFWRRMMMPLWKIFELVLRLLSSL